MSTVKGSCHCKAVKWEFTLPIKTVVKCHCQNCRKLQGSDYSSWVIVPQEQLEITSGKEYLSKYEASELSSKTFCSLCGSSTYLMNGKHFPDHFVIPLGAIDNYSEVLAPQIQVYTADKAAWVSLHDDEPVLN
ncbi:GFA family protein [Psychromonas sp. CNPT3]|uniref:GFA family protein n=1 Tax=Psychromonas sp. CNPT3 TaxID=314282 RepID=UPI00006E9D13|nr:GFA family protein [Psychromonas sp. CNPT3]AGH81174.1 GFA family protein [Psychromonas sp. CNPT3]